jgi:hypothetical protein
VTTTDTPQAFEITFADQTMQVTVPDENQVAVLIAAQHWFRQQRRALDRLEPEIDAIPQAARKDHPLVQEWERLAAEGIKHVGRFQGILKTLFLDPEDWDFIQDGMVEKRVKWQDVADLPALILEARNAAAAGEPANRAARRASKKTSGRLAR